DDLAVVDQLNLPRLAEEGDRRRREEHLPVARADEQRALPACADQLARVVVVDDDEREVSFELRVRRATGLAEVGAVVALAKVRDDLCVGLGVEGVPLSFEGLLQLPEVLHDPVQNDRELLPVAACQRMRILLGDPAVCRPPRVAEPGRRLGAVGAGRLLQRLEVAYGADVVEAVVLEHGEPCGVVAAVLEALEPAQKKGFRLPAADVSDDPAHPISPFALPFREASIEGVMRTPPIKRTKPGCSSGRRVASGQPSSRVTRAVILAQSSAAFCGFSASARTRTTGSVPDGRTR